MKPRRRGKATMTPPTRPVEHAPRAGVAEGRAALPRHRFTYGDVIGMLDAGGLQTSDAVELIEGELIDMSPGGPGHAEIVDRLLMVFADVMDRVQLRAQGSLRLSEEDVVAPDFMLLRKRDGGYLGSLPAAQDVLLLIEVADASLDRDLGVKRDLYCRFGIDDYWVVNIPERSIVAHTQPGPSGYGHARAIRGPAWVAPRCFPEKKIGEGTIFW